MSVHKKNKAHIRYYIRNPKPLKIRVLKNKVTVSCLISHFVQAEEDVDKFLREEHDFDEYTRQVKKYHRLVQEIQYNSIKVSYTPNQSS